MAKKYRVIVGATSLMAEHCARRWLEAEPCDIVLVGRHEGRLEAVAADLKVRSPEALISTVVLEDFTDAKAIAGLAETLSQVRVPDMVLIAHGHLPDQQQCQTDPDVCRATIMINAVSPVLFAEAFAGVMQKAGRGTLGLIGSVAGDRGRRSNYVYGASKGMVARYAEGLQHRFAQTDVRIVMIKPGPTDTPMASDFKAKGMKLAPVDEVAAVIVNGMNRGVRTIYAPGRWRYIMCIIRHLPFFVFGRLDI